MQLLYSNLKRIYGVLPDSMHGAVWGLFLLMSLLALIELASIMSITGYFAVMNRPELVTETALGQNVLFFFPKLAALMSDHREFVLWSCLVPIGLIVLKNVFSAMVAWRSSLLGERVSSYIGSSIMERYLYMPYSWHLSAESSQALTCMQWRFSLGQMLLHILTAYSNIITVILLFLGLFLYEPGVTVSSIVVMIATSIATYALLRARIDRASQRAAQAQQKETEATVVALGGVREVQIYQQQPVFLAAIRNHVREGMRPRSFLGMCAAVPSWTLESAGFLLIWFAVYALIRFQGASVPEITTAVALLALTAWRVLPSLNRVVGSTVSIRGLQPTALPCLEYFEKLQCETPECAHGAAKGFQVCREIVFDHVSYRYPGAEQDALTDISLRIPVGATLGLVGRSGAGKSTFINILSGLLEPTSGRLLVDGKPMSRAELTAYRQQIGYVPQNPYMMAGSVAQNVAFRDWGKPLDGERVRRACCEAAIDFLGPDCGDIGRDAKGLSGGQAQRVAIARALYAEPSLLILDEATSALDQASEKMVQHSMINFTAKRTCVIAAHRQATLEICSTILWLENGLERYFGRADKVNQAYKEFLIHDVEEVHS